MKSEWTRTMQRRAHELIPGGAHTYAKGDDQYPEEAPAFIVRGQGCHVWDSDGNEYIEYGAGLRAVALGHAYAPVVEAAQQQMLLGANFTRPALIEVECAEKVLELIRAGEMVKFAKNGSDVTTAAVKLARAYTGCDLVAICAEHPFFSVDDWFIGSTPMAAGIPQAIRDLTLKFHYNDIDSLVQLFDAHPGQIACVVLEAETVEPPKDGFLPAVQALCRQRGALFVLDETITGFRWHNGGAQQVYGLDPDLSCFGKAIANGFSVAALVGRRDVMELGGLNTNAERVFLLSTTHGAETHALAAAIKTMEVYQTEDVIGHLHRQGERLRCRLNHVARDLGIHEYFQVIGRPSNLIYVTRDGNGERSQEFRTLFMQETLRRGLLMPSLVVNYSHTDEDVERTIDAVSEALVIYRSALENGVGHYLEGRPVKPVFRRYC